MRKILLVSLLSLTSAGGFAQEIVDLLIRNGRIVDGSGNPWFRADLGIRNGRIARIGDLSGASASEIIDAAGRIVAPGFIDLHSHADRGLADPELRFNQSFLYQGVTR